MDKEQDFWSHPDTVNLYEGNAGDLYIGRTLGPWYRMDNTDAASTFSEDAYAYAAENGDWGQQYTEATDPAAEGCFIVAEYRDGRTRYTFDAYTTSARPGIAARAYVGPDAEG